MLSAIKQWRNKRWQEWLDQRLPVTSSITLTQRGIFILPTQQGVFFGGLLILMLIAAINYTNSLIYALVFWLGALLMVSMLQTWRNLSCLHIKNGGVMDVYAGEIANYQVILESDKHAHYAMRLGWTPQLRSADVPYNNTVTVTLAQVVPHRGVYIAPRFKIESRFPLGLMVAWSWIQLDQAAFVYPQAIEGSLPVMSGSVVNIEHDYARGKQTGVDDFDGLRAFVTGDSLRRISWKVFSREQGLWVKQFHQNEGGTLDLDFAQAVGDIEHRLSVLCYWVNQLTEQGQSFSLQLPHHVIEQGQGLAHQRRCLRALAGYGFEQS